MCVLCALPSQSGDPLTLRQLGRRLFGERPIEPVVFEPPDSPKHWQPSQSDHTPSDDPWRPYRESEEREARVAIEQTQSEAAIDNDETDSDDDVCSDPNAYRDDIMSETTPEHNYSTTSHDEPMPYVGDQPTLSKQVAMDLVGLTVLPGLAMLGDAQEEVWEEAEGDGPAPSTPSLHNPRPMPAMKAKSKNAAKPTVSSILRALNPSSAGREQQVEMAGHQKVGLKCCMVGYDIKKMSRECLDVDLDDIDDEDECSFDEK